MFRRGATYKQLEAKTRRHRCRNSNINWSYNFLTVPLEKLRSLDSGDPVVLGEVLASRTSSQTAVLLPVASRSI